MPSIGLIAGNGRFPLLVLDAAHALGHEVTVVAVREETGPDLEARAAQLGAALHTVSLGQLGRAIQVLQQAGCRQAVMAGHAPKDAALESVNTAGRAVQFAGTTVIISPWILHRHELLWEDPAEFRPERFLPENRKSVDRYAYIPFSAGPRVCIGAAFAMQDAMIALAAILRAAEVEAITPVEPRPIHQITLRSRAPIRLRLRARKAA